MEGPILSNSKLKVEPKNINATRKQIQASANIKTSRYANNSNKTIQSLPYLIDIESLADHLGVGVRFIRRLVTERRIPFIKCGRFIRFDPNEIEAWVEKSRVSPRS